MPWPFTIADLEVNDQSWVPVLAPHDCNFVGIKNPLDVDVFIKTDDDTFDTISSNMQEGITSPYLPYTITSVTGWSSTGISRVPISRSTEQSSRFLAGSTVVYVKCSAGSGIIKLRFLC